MNELVKGAMVAISESAFLSLCLDNQKSVSIESYLFIDNKVKEVKLNGFEDISFRFAKKEDIGKIEEKCGLPFEGYYQELIKNIQI